MGSTGPVKITFFIFSFFTLSLAILTSLPGPTTNKQRLEWHSFIGENSQEEDERHYFDNLPSYDLLWDVCVRYAKEFFGEEIDIFNIGGIGQTFLERLCGFF